MNTLDDSNAALAALYTPGQLDVLTQLNDLKESIGLSDGAFVRKFLTVSSTAWSRINSGKYGADGADMFGKLAVNLRQLRIKLAQDAKLTGARKFHAFAQQQAVVDAVTTCLLKPADDQNRFVAYLAGTGGGKTALGRELKVMHDGIYVEARESWRRGYFAALVDIGRAAGCEMGELLKGERFAEAAVLARFSANRRVLIIDEAEYFGPRTMNLLKLLLNQTPTVVVVLTLPELFARLRLYAAAEFGQLVRRAEAIVELTLVTPDEVTALLVERVAVNAEGKQIAGMIARNANEFGNYDLVDRVVKQLASEAGEDAVTLDDVTQAIRCVKRLMNRAA